MKRTPFDAAFGGDYIAAEDFGGKAVTLTIADVGAKELLKPDMSKEWRYVLTFRGTKRGIVLNKTNALCLKAMWGEADPETGKVYIEQWIGHRVTFYPAPDTSGMSDSGLCIRVKGSPELKKPLKFTAKVGLGKKNFSLVPTGAEAEDVPFGESEASDDGATVDPETGEITTQEPLQAPDEADTTDEPFPVEEAASVDGKLL